MVRAGPGRPRIRPDRLVGDKGYSYTSVRKYLHRRGIRVTIPRRKDQGDDICFDAELSPSGHGLHLLLRARVPRTVRLPDVECVKHEFLAVTGQAIQVPAQLLDATHDLER